MNKQEAINEIKGMTVETLFSGSLFVSQPKVIELVKQIKEPYKPVIPWYIAEWIEKAKSDDDYNVVGAVNEAPQGEVSDWLILENVNTFAKAWVNGYEVEKEKRYRVKFKGMRGDCDYLNYGVSAREWFMCSRFNFENVRTHFTHKELEDAGFGWVFDCEGIEVEEVK